MRPGQIARLQGSTNNTLVLMAVTETAKKILVSLKTGHAWLEENNDVVWRWEVQILQPDETITCKITGE